MLAHTFSLFASLAAGLSLLLGSVLAPFAAPAQAPVGPGAPGEPAGAARPDGFRRGGFQGDPLVRQVLILAAVSATGQRPAAVWEALSAGHSLAEIAAAAGKTSADVLAVFDESVRYRLDQAVANGRLPESLAEARAAWYAQAAGQMVEQPGLVPAYPGLHELHAVLIAASAKTGELTRLEIRRALGDCRSLEDILGEAGHTGQQAVETAMGAVNAWLDRQVQAGKLDETRRASWETGLEQALTLMLATPGLHVAGRECAP